MPSHKDIVESYFEGFRQGDHQRILALLTEDVVWNLPGHAQLSGKEAFDNEIENEAFTGRPILTVDRLVEEGDSVVAIGNGEGTLTSGEPFQVAFCTVLTFAADLIARVESYIVPLGEAPAGSG